MNWEKAWTVFAGVMIVLIALAIGVSAGLIIKDQYL